jgi:hypothetical protein
MFNTQNPASLNSVATTHPPDGVRYTCPVFIRVTPELRELVREAAAIEDRGISEWGRDALIFRLAQLGLVPVITGDDDTEAEAA